MTARRKILITGASGFLGCRLVEVLLENGTWDIRAMAHNPGRAVRLARHKVEIVWADLLNAVDLENAVSEVNVVVHCAYGSGSSATRATTVEGTRNLLIAATKAKVERFIHISTIGIHSYSPPQNVTEESGYKKSSDAYCNDKIDAERIVRKLYPSAVILRMGNIFGPWSAPWTIRPLTHISEGKVAIVDGGLHACNMVYIDNAVEAIRQALDTPGSDGEVFFITDDSKPWSDLYGAYASWLNKEPVSVGHDEVKRIISPSPARRLHGFFDEMWQGIIVPSLRYTAFRAAVSPTLGAFLSRIWQRIPLKIRYKLVGDPLGGSVPVAGKISTSEKDVYPSRGLLQIYSSKAVFQNKKAKRLMGYSPIVEWDEAIERTRLWAEWARLFGEKK